MTKQARHQDRYGNMLIQRDTVVAEFFIGTVYAGSTWEEARKMASELEENVDFSHVLMLAVDGSRIARPILKGEIESDLVAKFKRLGFMDEHCCMMEAA